MTCLWNPYPTNINLHYYNSCCNSQVDTDDVPGMEECCHEHDYCYDTCNSDRVTCDKDFKQCLHDICNKIKTSKTNKRVSYKGTLL